DHLLAAFSAHESWGIAGATLLDAEGKVEHAGATVRYPEVRGAHRTDVEEIPASAIDYVTGALFALRRSLWEAIGPFDEGFYPAYYEETDYCYRARQAGYEIGYVPAVQGVHLRSNQEWQQDTLLSALNQ